MFDFFTTQDAPVTITIDGKSYDLPRFLNPALIEWSAKLKKEQVDDAVSHLDDEGKARFKTFFQVPPLDTRYVVRMGLSPAGTAYVVDHCMAKAGIAKDVRDNVLANTDPLVIRNLADELMFAQRLVDKLKEEGEDTDPLTVPPPSPGGTPETGAAGTPASSTSTATAPAA